MIDSISNRCTFEIADGEDRFVGIRKSGEKIKISFPLGYKNVNDITDAKELRNEIMTLVTTLDRFAKTKGGQSCLLAYGENETNFPFRAYLYIIKDYLDNGYYHEREIVYEDNSKGKINWKRTIKQKKPLPAGNNFVYLDFIRKKEVTNYETYITLIHEFCVFESFSKIGWLYTDYMPMNPNVENNVEAFSAVIRQQLAVTFNDKKKALFSAMLDVINASEKESDSTSFSYGTNRFEYVWENMIDYVFGEDNIKKYFPRTEWHLVDKSVKNNSPLEPDTIIEFNNKLYIIDAKYYRYGVVEPRDASLLPGTGSISKQIIYGESAAKRCRDEGTPKEVYNAFVMPFRAKGDSHYEYIGYADGDWIPSCNFTKAPYEKVVGVLLDTCYLMNLCYKRDNEAIMSLVDIIDKSFDEIAKNDN